MSLVGYAADKQTDRPGVEKMVFIVLVFWFFLNTKNLERSDFWFLWFFLDIVVFV